VARLLHGAAVGIAWVVAPAYVGEMASIRIRGKLSLLVQLSYALGLLFSYFAGWLLGDYITLTIVSACVSVMSGVLFLFLPESPYYLMLDGRADDAAKCLWSLRSYTDDDLQTELLSVKDSISNNRYIICVMDAGISDVVCRKFKFRNVHSIDWGHFRLSVTLKETF
jgi:SP family facilitated glucose transporter-like MFS transporter 8